jgi:hypothetical protein
MARAIVRLPYALSYPEATKDVDVGAATVGEALRLLITREAHLRPRIYRSDGELIVGVFLNGRDVRRLEGLAGCGKSSPPQPH